MDLFSELKLLYLTPLIGASIGWLTNFVAIKMLFHPRKPVNLLFTKMQGVFPRRKTDIASKLGYIVANEFLTSEAISEQLSASENQREIIGSIGRRVEDRLIERAQKGPLAARLVLNDSVISKLRQMVEREIEKGIPHWLSELSQSEGLQQRIRSVVEQKIENFSEEELERMLFQLIKKELRFLEIWGAILSSPDYHQGAS